MLLYFFLFFSLLGLWFEALSGWVCVFVWDWPFFLLQQREKERKKKNKSILWFCCIEWFAIDCFELSKLIVELLYCNCNCKSSLFRTRCLKFLQKKKTTKSEWVLLIRLIAFFNSLLLNDYLNHLPFAILCCDSFSRVSFSFFWHWIHHLHLVKYFSSY